MHIDCCTLVISHVIINAHSNIRVPGLFHTHPASRAHEPLHCCLQVLVTGRDARGNVKLSRKALLQGGQDGGHSASGPPHRPQLQRSRTA